jgi:hypothetical protein
MSKKLKIGDLVSCYGAQGYSYGIVTKIGREFPKTSSKYKSGFADIQWSDLPGNRRVYECYASWDVISVEVRPNGKT